MTVNYKSVYMFIFFSLTVARLIISTCKNPIVRICYFSTKLRIKVYNIKINLYLNIYLPLSGARMSSPPETALAEVPLEDPKIKIYF